MQQRRKIGKCPIKLSVLSPLILSWRKRPHRESKTTEDERQTWQILTPEVSQSAVKANRPSTWVNYPFATMLSDGNLV